MREFFNMQGFPTIVVLGSDGVELDRRVGFGGNAEDFVVILQDWAENKNTLFSYLKKWAKDTTDVEWNYRIAMRYVDRFQTDFAQRFWHNVLTLDPQNTAGYHKIAEFNLALHEARTKTETKKLATFSGEFRHQ